MPSTTLASLPYELIELILSFATANTRLCTSPSPSAFTARLTWLRQTALTSRLFRYPSQSVLWSSLRVHSPAVAKRLLASPALGAFGSEELDIVGVHGGIEGLSGSTAGRVLGKVRGVRWLRLADFGRLSARVLCGEGMSGLKTLLLMTTFPDKPALLSTLHLPFHLLTLSLFNRSYPPAFLHTLFFSSSHTLTSLTLLTSASSPAYNALIDALPLVAKNLRHLSLQHRPSQRFVEEVVPLFTSLQHLEAHSAVDLSVIFSALPAPSPSSPPTLTHFTLELDYNLLDISTLLSTLLSASPTTSVLGKLRKLTIPRAPSTVEFREFGGARLLETCAERNIEVEVGRVVEWRRASLFD
ncbi:hypothetical protein JCM8547_001553 [Rhodosporidiobolus lusitaniae]